jgi:hypothetical protein
MAVPTTVRHYFVGALELPIEFLDEMLSGLDAGDPIWSYTPYPERFTLKSAMAHFADWNDIFRERIERTRDEDHPTLPDADEGQIAIDRDYENGNPIGTLASFKTSRRALIEVIKALSVEDWDRGATKIGAGELTISEHISLIMAHDDYHMRQVIDYRRHFAK